MTRNTFSRWTTAAAIAVLCMAIASVASAQTAYTWALTGPDGNWNDPGAWTAGMPNATGDVAAFLEPNLLTVSLNGLSVTVGQLQFLGDYATYTLNAGAGGVLHLNDANGLAVIAQMGTVTAANTGGFVNLNVPIVLDTNAMFYTNAARNADYNGGMHINGNISGTGSLTFSGPDGTDSFSRFFFLNGNNTFSGGMLVHRETVWGTTATAFGAGPITVDGGVLMSLSNDDANADHSANDLIVSGTVYNEVDLRSGSPLGWYNQGPNGAVTLKYKSLTWQAGDGTMETDGTGFSAINHKYSQLVFGKMTLEAGNHTLNDYGLEMHPGHVTGAGRLIIAGYDGRVVLDDNTNDFAGGVQVERFQQLFLGSTNPTGPGGAAIHTGTIVSYGYDNATADHSAINILQMAGGETPYGSLTLRQNFDATVADDPNYPVTHKFGNLTFETNTLLNTTGPASTNLQFVGTTTLNGASNISPYVRTTLVGKVTGSGSLVVPVGNGNAGLVLSNNSNDYTDGTVIGNFILITVPNALGAGPAYLNGGTLFSVAVDNASADHHLTNLIVQTGTGNIIGQQTLSSANYYDDPNITINHKFGNLDFLGQNLGFNAGTWDTNNDTIEITGTTTLNGVTSLSSYRQKLTLSGQVTGPGILKLPTQNGNQGVWLTNNLNDYTDGTQIDPDARLMITVGHALGAGPLYMNGGALNSNLANNADADYSTTAINVTATGSVINANGPGTGVFFKFGDLTFGTGPQTISFGGLRPDVVQITGTTTLTDLDTIKSTGGGPAPMIHLSGLVTGSGTLIQVGLAQGDGGTNTGGFVLTNTSNDYAGGTWVYGRFGITGANVTGTGPINLAGGNLWSEAADNASANHTTAGGLIVMANSTLSVAQGWTGNNLNASVTNDPNVIWHKYGNLTFGAQNLTLTTGGDAGDLLSIEGTTTLNGPSSFNSGGPGLRLNGPVVGDGPLVTTGGITFLGSANNTFSAGASLAGGTLALTKANQLGAFAVPDPNYPDAGTAYLRGGTLFSLATTNANADHSTTNLNVTASSAVTMGSGWVAGTRLNNDPNVVIHKYNNVTFAAPNLSLSSATDLNDELWFQGTVTLNGNTTFPRGYLNVNYNWGGPWVSQSIRFNGEVTADATNGGNFITNGANGQYWAGATIYYLTNNNNDYGDTIVSAGSTQVVATAAHALGTGTIYLNGGSLVSVAENDANADHSINNIMVNAAVYNYGVGDGSAAFPQGGGTQPPCVVGARFDNNGNYGEGGQWVTHKFGNLGFSSTGYNLFAGDWNTNSDVIEFVGTTSLNGRTYLTSWRQQITLAGPVVDGANAGQLVTPSANGGMGVWLLSNNTYSGGTEIQGNAATDGTFVSFVVASAPHALGTGPVALNNGRLYSAAWDDANADHSANNVTIMAGGGNITAMKNVANMHNGSISFTDYAEDANIARVTHKFGNLTFAAQGLTLGAGGWGGTLMNTYPTDIVKFVGTTTLNGVTHFYAYQPIELGGLVTGDATNGGILDVSALPANSPSYVLVSHNNNDYAGGTFIFGGTLSVTGTNGLGTGNIVSQVGSVLNLLGTNSVDNASINVTNDGLLHVGAGASSLVGDVVPSAALAGTVQLDAGSALSVHKVVQNAVSVGAAATLTVRGGSATTNVLNNLTIAGATNAWTGTVDTRQNYLVVNNGNLATMTNQIASGLNPNGNLWTGTGITSSVAASDGNGATALGIARASDLGLAGQPLTALIPDADPVTLSASSVIVRQTLFGDADMNGTVDADLDLTQWFAGFANYQNLAVDPNLFDPNITGWLYGDFNYDGVVDADLDLTQWFAGFAVSQNQAAAPGAPGAVPEPATLVLLGLGAVSLLTRRNRKA